MPLTSFCGLLTLQVGAAVLSAVFFTLAGVITAANAFHYINEEGGFPINLVLMVVFVIGLIIAALLMFASSYAESRTLAIASMVVIALLTCYWIILCCFSFVNDPKHIGSICMSQRCPESFWIADLGYRVYKVNNTLGQYAMNDVPYDDDYQSEETSQEKIYLQRSFVRNETYVIDHKELRDDGYKQYIYGDNDYGNEKKRKYISSRGLPFIGAIILFILNLLFLIFSALVMWSWASELDWADYYIEDEPVVVYEEPYVDSF